METYFDLLDEYTRDRIYTEANKMIFNKVLYDIVGYIEMQLNDYCEKMPYLSENEIWNDYSKDIYKYALRYIKKNRRQEEKYQKFLREHPDYEEFLNF